MKDIFRSACADIKAGLVVFDRHGTVLYVNELAQALAGLKGTGNDSRSEALFDWLMERGVLKGTRPLFDVYVIPDGSPVAVHASPTKEDDLITGIVVLLFPIEEIEKGFFVKAGSPKELTDDLEAVIENTYDGLYITDGNANTLMINKAYERITGIRREEVLGKNMRDLVSSGVFDRSVSLEVLEKKAPVTIMQELRSGKKVLVTGNPVFDESGKGLKLIITNVRDITELIELKDKLHERTLEANRYLAELDKIKTLQLQQTKFATKSKKMMEVLETAIKASQFDSNILITGESGVGKGLMAKLIHESSERKDYPFVVINCAGIPEDLFESELFGYEPGAFSGASAKGKKGLLEVADRGTVFLDEIGDMSLRLQSKLLRVIEEKVMTRLGSTKTVQLNIRVIAATNQDINALIESKKFRQDLFFRINTISIVIPPLRERIDDVIPIIQYFTQRINERYHMKKHFSSNALQALMSYHYPGNVRELSNIVEQAYLISKNNTVDTEDLPFQVRSIVDRQGFLVDSENKTYTEIIDLMEYKVLKNAIEKYGSTHKAAKNLKISQSTIVRKMKKFNLKIQKDKQPY